MTAKNGNTTQPERNQSAEKNANGLTLPPGAFASADAFISALAGELGPEFRELTGAMTGSGKREFEEVAMGLIAMAPEQRARIAKYLASERAQGGAE